MLPIDGDRLDVRPLVRDEVLYVSAEADRTRNPVTMDALASAPLVFYDAESADNDPIRRQLADQHKPTVYACGPRVEVEYMELALRLVAAGTGDTYLPSAYTQAPYFPRRLTTTTFSPPLYDTFAVITRQAARLSPATRELISELSAHAEVAAAWTNALTLRAPKLQRL